MPKKNPALFEYRGRRPLLCLITIPFNSLEASNKRERSREIFRIPCPQFDRSTATDCKMTEALPPSCVQTTVILTI